MVIVHGVEGEAEAQQVQAVKLRLRLREGGKSKAEDEVEQMLAEKVELARWLEAWQDLQADDDFQRLRSGFWWQYQSRSLRHRINYSRHYAMMIMNKKNTSANM